LRGLDPDELKEKGDALLVTGKGKESRVGIGAGVFGLVVMVVVVIGTRRP